MLKTRLLGGLATLVLLAGTLPALADNTDTQTVNVSGDIIATLELTVNNDLTMPDLVAPATGEGNSSVTYSNAGAVSYTGNGDPGTTNGNGSEQLASLSATGEATYSFSIATGNITGFGSGVSFTPDCPSTGNVGTAFSCGGTTTATDAAVPGAYSGTFDVTVTYN